MEYIEINNKSLNGQKLTDSYEAISLCQSQRLKEPRAAESFNGTDGGHQINEGRCVLLGVTGHRQVAKYSTVVVTHIF